MKKILSRFSYIYTSINLLSYLIAFIISSYIKHSIPFEPLSLSNIFIATLVCIAYMIFDAKKYNEYLKTALSLVVLTGGIIISKILFGRVIFAYSAIIYILFFIIAVVYSSFIIGSAVKAKKEENILNNFIKDLEKTKNK